MKNFDYILTDFNPFRPNPGHTEQNKLNFYFHISLKAFIKPFEPPQKCMKIKI